MGHRGSSHYLERPLFELLASWPACPFARSDAVQHELQRPLARGQEQPRPVHDHRATVLQGKGLKTERRQVSLLGILTVFSLTWYFWDLWEGKFSANKQFGCSVQSLHDVSNLTCGQVGPDCSRKKGGRRAWVFSQITEPEEQVHGG